MADLVDLIRAELERGYWKLSTETSGAAAKGKAAILAVLDIHGPDIQHGSVSAKTGKCCMCDGYGEPLSVFEKEHHGETIPMHAHTDRENPACAVCGNWYEGEPYPYPCDTVVSIAKELGLIAAVNS
jgi:hypothetical protein